MAKKRPTKPLGAGRPWPKTSKIPRVFGTWEMPEVSSVSSGASIESQKSDVHLIAHTLGRSHDGSLPDLTAARILIEVDHLGERLQKLLREVPEAAASPLFESGPEKKKGRHKKPAAAGSA
jgi:hypothetical protein